MFGLIKKIFIGLLTGPVIGWNHTKCVSLSNQNCDIQLILVTVACRVQIWKKKHFVKIVTILVTVLSKMTFCLSIYFVFKKTPLF